jgi:hypothetical protein
MEIEDVFVWIDNKRKVMTAIERKATQEVREGKQRTLEGVE